MIRELCVLCCVSMFIFLWKKILGFILRRIYAVKMAVFANINSGDGIFCWWTHTYSKIDTFSFSWSSNNSISRKIEIIITISAQMDLIECLIIILNTVSFINFYIYLTNQLCLPLAKMKFRFKFIYNVLFLDCVFMIQLIQCMIRPADFFISCKILKKKT